MDDCSRWREDLIELLFGRLDEEEEIALNEHLLHCPVCREEERKLLALREEIASDAPPVDPALRERVKRALPGKKRPAIVRLLRRPVPAYAAVAAALLVALLARSLPPVETGQRRGRQVAVASGAGAPFVPAGAFTTSWGTGSATGAGAEWPDRSDSIDVDSL